MELNALVEIRYVDLLDLAPQRKSKPKLVDTVKRHLENTSKMLHSFALVNLTTFNVFQEKKERTR
jgi:hypothetical protein